MQSAKRSRIGGVVESNSSRMKKGQDKSENAYVKSRLRRATLESTAAGADNSRKRGMRRSYTGNNADHDDKRNPPIVRRTKSESQRFDASATATAAERNNCTKSSDTDSNCNLSVEELNSSRSEDSPNCNVELAQTNEDLVKMETEHLVDLDPINTDETTPTTPPSLSYQLQETQSKFQNIADLVMWKDISRSAFVFGFGSFLLLSSSFARDVNFSIISALCYMALIYLAAVFFYRSLNSRKNNGLEDSNREHSLGIREEDVVWLIHFILPYLNGIVFNMCALFSGDPKTTFKLGIILFLLARCGNSITIWNMAKLGFLGVFFLPKVCSLYSTELIKYGKFWMKRFEDAWDSCSNKKVVLIVIFTLIWNLFSITARIWAVFMLVVAVRCYQQCLCLPKEDWKEQHLDGCAGGAQAITD